MLTKAFKLFYLIALILTGVNEIFMNPGGLSAQILPEQTIQQPAADTMTFRIIKVVPANGDIYYSIECYNSSKVGWFVFQDFQYPDEPKTFWTINGAENYIKRYQLNHTSPKLQLVETITMILK